METFVALGGWRGPSLVLNLLTFFLGFSALAVGLLLAARLRRALKAPRLEGAVMGFLAAGGALALRSLALLLFDLKMVPRLLALIVGDLALVGCGLGLFGALWAFERYLRTPDADAAGLSPVAGKRKKARRATSGG